jgi:hypothetical protein
MLQKARREPNSIDKAHLDEVESALDAEEANEQDAHGKTP